ncbi:MAG TPA: tRNA 2-selenouridine(34) synthase MnmH [Edaphocola sp.]|nr:tRNA 2-selenouridine(34) synthase MnmH [Edaphocola sp.]
MMATKRIDINEFLRLSNFLPVIDVRSPSEYAHSHIPKAVSIPIFSDEERKEIGTTYKQKTRELAIKIGFDFFGKKMRAVIEQVEALLKEIESKEVIVHCWRGGMRSNAFSWLLDFYGFKVYTLEGGYKGFRNWVLQELAAPHPLIILSGKTGSGKTEILNQIASQNIAVIDLEALAKHKGSAFGGIGMQIQDSNEQFENNLAIELLQIKEKIDKEHPIWLESESSRIGDININYLFFNQMKTAPRVHIEIPFEERLAYIVEGYGQLKNEELIKATERIQKRLGGLETRNVIQFITSGQIKEAFEILLRYYDKAYAKGNIYQQEVINIHFEKIDAQKNAGIIIKETEKYYGRK